MRTFLGMLLWGGLLAVPAAGRAESPVHSYAVVVGSNQGGAGQAHLSFAERDAERMSDVLVELGRTPRENVLLLKQPSALELEHALLHLSAVIADHATHGERSQVVFYYSGHARSRALSLGAEEVSLDSLRKTLTGLPSTLTVVVLDACQSGAFSGVKGATPAADFSLSSVNDLHSQGIAVMASSTAAELSQESPELGSSYFSHHLIAALRGAGDQNADGHISLDEAYGYAYQQTLSDTARTQVGSQHATLETDIRGTGDVPLSYPVDASSHLVLPAELDARVMIQKDKRGAVIAEIVKAKGTPLSLALPPGLYDVLLRRSDGRDTRSCPVNLVHGTTLALDTTHCSPISEAQGLAKQGLEPELREQSQKRERWFWEIGPAINWVEEDRYTRTLEQFRFGEDLEKRQALTWDTALGVGLHRNVSLLARYDHKLEHRGYARSLQGPDGQTRAETFDWTTRAVSFGVRGRLPLKQEWIVAFAEVDLGLGFARTHMKGTAVNAIEHFYGPVWRAVAGLTFGIAEHFGAYLSAGYAYAPVTENLIGQSHNDGGVTLQTGIRLRSLKGVW